MKRERSWNRRAAECTAKPFLYAGVALALVGMAFCPKPASALSISGNDWKVTLGGEINGFYEYSSCSGGTQVGGLALGGNALGCAGRGGASSIGNGLLPNILSATFTTNQAGWDLSAKTSLMTSIATTTNVSANNSLDVRQAYFTFGKKSVGTFKIGRDYGIFASNAILSDMTLIGVGVPAQSQIRAGGTDGVSGRVALGHIGAGYSYLGSYGQITYTSPTFSGFTFSGGVFSPVDNFVGTYQSRGQPQFQAQLAWSSDM
ncbi:MAG: porin, partial [Sinobacteraceae bacterium]|nr:porin [Nevskiaceae bacterium]